MAVTKQHTPDELRQLIRDKTQSSLYDFCWDILNYKAMHQPLHKDIVCDFLTNWKPGKDIKVLLLPREHLKSTIASISLPIWLWSLDPSSQPFPCGPETRVLLSHGKRDMACDYLREQKHHFSRNERLRWVYPEICYDKPDKHSDLWQQDAFNIPRSEPSKVPSIKASGTNSAVVGFHFNWIVYDDLVYKENVGTPELRAKTLQYFQQCQSLVMRGGKQLVIGTRWHWDDLYGSLLDPQGPYADIVDALVLRSGYFDEDPVFPISPIVDKCGFDMERLEFRRKAMGDYEFFGQYENSPQRSSSQSFSKDNFHRFRMDYDDKVPGDRQVAFVLSVDPNRSTKIGNDPCGITVAGVDQNGEIWGVDGFRGHPSRAQLIDIMFDFAVRWNVAAIILETTAGQEYLVQDFEAEMIARGRRFKVIEAKRGPTNRKDDRIMAVQAPSERGHIHLLYGEFFDSMIDEFVNYGVAKHDDLADTMADIVIHGRDLRPVAAKVTRKEPPKSPFLLKSLMDDNLRPGKDRVVRRASR